MIRQADRILRGCGTSCRNVVRTWFYLPEILEWYAEFNAARTAQYQEFGVLPEGDAPPAYLPASTAIGGELASAPAGGMDLLAVVPTGGGELSVRRLRNPAQEEAYRYGSAFVRGAVICGPTECLIEVSGTAAVDEAGRSLHPGNARAQISCTLQKVAILLAEVGAELKDIGAATVFVKRAEVATMFREVLADLGLDRFPSVCVVADVCRPELLFELDAEAVIARQG
jgi:enamine deaminase RidA (YjgF/YER057c/UK114 family)